MGENEMKNRIIGIAAVTAFLSSSVFAGERFISASYANLNSDGVSTNGIGFGWHMKFGEKIKQAFGVDYFLSEESNELNDSKGNAVNAHYDLGYGFWPNTTLYGSIGYGAQAVGSYVNSSGQKEDVMAVGMSIGAGLYYSLNNNFDINASYKQYKLGILDLDYTLNIANIGLAYKY